MHPDFVEEVILRTLKESENSLTILEIAEKTHMHRITASKYLAVLEAKGHVTRRDVGRAKLYSHNKILVPHGINHREEEE